MKLSTLLVTILLVGPAVVAQEGMDEKLQALKDAVAAKDIAKVKTLTQELQPLVTAALAEKAPTETSAKEAFTARIDYAKSVQSYAEYALYTVALPSPNATYVELIGMLEQQYPKSSYLDGAYGRYLVALGEGSTSAKVLPVAEKALANHPQNEDLLLWLADNALTRKQNDRALALANRLVAAMKRPKPEAYTAAQWEAKRSLCLGRGHWMAGVISGEKGQYMASDQNLRAALPFISGNNAMMAPALFYLGVSNYNLGKMTLKKARLLEGASFSDKCAALDSPYSDQAHRNALLMRDEANKMR